VWHEVAQRWQTPGVGEETVKAMVETPRPDRIANYEGLGIPSGVAGELADALDETMGRCILALYRDAAQPALIDMAANLPAAAAKPGLVIVASEDHFVGDEAMARHSAEAAGAQVTVLSGLGHWWMLQDPEAGAAALEGFWSGIGR
jgi:pimeloyl-ACP methyl ester carboxylesterase